MGAASRGPAQPDERLPEDAGRGSRLHRGGPHLQLTADLALRRSPDTAWQVIGDEAVIMNLAGARVLGLNSTAALVWALLEEYDEAAMATAVAERFEVDAETAARDVREFLALLRERGLVVDA